MGTEKVSIFEMVCIHVSTRSTGFAAKEVAAIAKKQNLERVIHQARTTRCIRLIHQVKLQLLFGLLHRRRSTIHAAYGDDDGL